MATSYRAAPAHGAPGTTLRRGRGRWRSLVLALEVALLLPLDAGAAPDLLLVHSFQIPGHGTWTRLDLAPPAAAWRVGSADGPAATEAQLQAVRRSVPWMLVGSPCPGVTRGATHLPCALELRPPSIDGEPVLRGWLARGGDLLLRFADQVIEVSSTPAGSIPSPGLQSAGLPPELPLAADLVALVAEPGLLRRLTQGGAAMSLQIRVSPGTGAVPAARQGVLVIGTGRRPGPGNRI